MGNHRQPDHSSSAKRETFPVPTATAMSIRAETRTGEDHTDWNSERPHVARLSSQHMSPRSWTCYSDSFGKFLRQSLHAFPSPRRVLRMSLSCSWNVIGSFLAKLHVQGIVRWRDGRQKNHVCSCLFTLENHAAWYRQYGDVRRTAAVWHLSLVTVIPLVTSCYTR